MNSTERSFRKKLSLVAAVFVLSAGISASGIFASNVDNAFLGHWSALSKNFYSILGAMDISSDRIVWTAQGPVRYHVILETPLAVYLELEREIDCGRYVRLGPIEHKSLEVAFYTAKENLERSRDLLSKRKKREPDDFLCSWGVYVRLQPS